MISVSADPASAVRDAWPVPPLEKDLIAALELAEALAGEADDVSRALVALVEEEITPKPDSPALYQGHVLIPMFMACLRGETPEAAAGEAAIPERVRAEFLVRFPPGADLPAPALAGWLGELEAAYPAPGDRQRVLNKAGRLLGWRGMPLPAARANPDDDLALWGGYLAGWTACWPRGRMPDAELLAAVEGISTGSHGVLRQGKARVLLLKDDRTLPEFLTDHGRAALFEDPEFCLSLAVIKLKTGEPEKARMLLAAAREAAAEGKVPPGRHRVPLSLALAPVVFPEMTESEKGLIILEEPNASKE